MPRLVLATQWLRTKRRLYRGDDEIDEFREPSSARRETAPHSGSYASGGATRRCAGYRNSAKGGLAQLGEHLLCKQGVVGSIPSSSTKEMRESIAKRDRDKRFAIGFYRTGCWIFNNSEEVNAFIQEWVNAWVVIVSSSFPSIEPARGTEKHSCPVTGRLEESGINVMGSSD